MLPCGISSVFILSHCITLTILLCKHCTYGIIDISIVPILYYGVTYPLFKLVNRKQCTLPGNPHLKSHLISVWKTHAEICWQLCLSSGCVANSLFFWNKGKETWESDEDSPNSKPITCGRSDSYQYVLLRVVSTEYLPQCQACLLWNIIGSCIRSKRKCSCCCGKFIYFIFTYK